MCACLCIICARACVCVCARALITITLNYYANNYNYCINYIVHEFIIDYIVLTGHNGSENISSSLQGGELSLHWAGII